MATAKAAQKVAAKAVSKVQIAELSAMGSTDYAWIWQIFLSRKAGAYTLSCQQTYSGSGDIEHIAPTAGLEGGSDLLEELDNVWYGITQDGATKSELVGIVVTICQAFPDLTEPLKAAWAMRFP